MLSSNKADWIELSIRFGARRDSVFRDDSFRMSFRAPPDECVLYRFLDFRTPNTASQNFLANFIIGLNTLERARGQASLLCRSNSEKACCTWVGRLVNCRLPW